MDKNYEHECEYKIEDALVSQANEIRIPKDMFSQIKLALINKKEYTQYRFKELAATFMISFAILFASACIFSRDVRAAAGEVVNVVKSIFLVEWKGSSPKIIQIPSDKYLSPVTYSQKTYMSDNELGKKLGFPITYPKFLSDECKFQYKELRISTGIEISYDKMEQVREILNNAIEDNYQYDSLKEYSPYFSTSGTYKINEKEYITIQASSQRKFESLERTVERFIYDKVKLGNNVGYWVEVPYPHYPTKLAKGITYADETKKPTKFTKEYMLLWDANGVRYSIGSVSYKGNLEGISKLAISFIEQQSRN